MQESSWAMKVKFIADGNEIADIIKLGEISLEKGTIDVPGFNRITKIQTGVKTIPEVAATFETRRNTGTRKQLQDWMDGNEHHDVTVIYCDAGGVEVFRDMWQAVECKKYTRPEVDHANVAYAKMDVIFLPYDIIPV